MATCPGASSHKGTMQNGSCLEQPQQSSSGDDPRAIPPAGLRREPVAAVAMAALEKNINLTGMRMTTALARTEMDDDTTPDVNMPTTAAATPATANATEDADTAQMRDGRTVHKPTTMRPDDSEEDTRPSTNTSLTRSTTTSASIQSDTSRDDSKPQRPSETCHTDMPNDIGQHQEEGWPGKQIILCGLRVEGLNGRRGRVRTGQPAGDRYTVDVEGGQTVKLKPINMRAATQKSEWIPWNPPERATRLASEAVQFIRRKIEWNEGPTQLDRLRRETIAMFQTIWRSREDGARDPEAQRTLDWLRKRGDMTTQHVIGQVMQLIVDIEDWHACNLSARTQPAIMCCARCLEDAVQQAMCK